MSIPSESPSSDVIKFFGIDLSNLDKELEEQPGKAYFWAVRASEAQMELELFEEIELAHYLTHCRRYAKVVLEQEWKKVTVEGLNDTVIELFSNLSAEGKEATIRRCSA